MSTDDKDVQGEGNREASRRYRDKTEQFIESGKVEEAAKNAIPTSRLAPRARRHEKHEGHEDGPSFSVAGDAEGVNL
jgi:hypothetical protein